MSQHYLENSLLIQAERHAFAERTKRISKTWRPIASDEDFLKMLPVTFKDLGSTQNGYERTANEGFSVPLVGGGALVFSQMILEIDTLHVPIRKLVICLTSTNTRGEKVTKTNLVINQYVDDVKYLKPRTGDDKFSQEFADQEALNMMANFQPYKDIDWNAIKNPTSPVVIQLAKIWKYAP